MTNKWLLHRAGLLNFWYYDEEYFHFADGRLFLRGSNGSGKSVTMQSLIPVLLDGKKTPDRLDPFGSRARRMEDYLLGERELVDRDERTGYLFLEYKRKHSDHYITTGIGLRAKRQKGMDFWGFVIFDNRRIGKDICLYKKEKTGEKFPLTKRELITLLGDGGTVVDTQKEYMELVNKHIFRFESLEAFQELIELLIQLRSPKLSKDFKPTVIYEILESSLPPLTDEELRHLSETIENMDQAKQQLEQLERDETSLRRLCQHYQQYNEYMIWEKANEWLKTVKQEEALTEEQEQCWRDQQQSTARLEELKAEIKNLQNEQAVLRKRELDLASHEVFRAEEKYRETKQRFSDGRMQIEKKERQLDEKQRQERKWKQEIAAAEQELDQSERAMEEQLEELRYSAEETAFAAHDLNEADFARHRGNAFDFALWRKEAEAHEKRLEEIVSLWARHDNLKLRYEDAYHELGEQQRLLDDLHHEAKKWAELLESEKSSFQEAVFAWKETYPDLPVEEETMRSFLRYLHELYERYHFEDVKKLFADRYYEALERRKAEKLRWEHEIGLVQQEIAETEEELRRWKTEKDPELEHDEQTAQARAALRTQGVAYVPFYASVEFYDHVPEAVRERIESSLYHAGVLDALVTETDVPIVHDRILRPNPVELAHTLADYLRPDIDERAGVSAARVESVLRSIIIADEAEEGHFVINESGSYSFGLLKGHAPQREQALFIGRNVRKRWRLAKIAEFEAKLEHLHHLLGQKLEQLADVEAKIAALHEAMESFPSDRDVRTAFDEWDRKQRAIASKQQEVEQKSEKLNQLVRAWQEIKQTLREQTEGLDLEWTKARYEEARQAMKEYVRHLTKLELEHRTYLHRAQALRYHQDQLAAVQEEIDEIKGDLSILEGSQQRILLELQHMEQTLRQMGADDLRAEISRVRDRLEWVNQTLPDKLNEKARIEQALQSIERQQRGLERKLRFTRILLAAWQRSFTAELELGFVEVTEKESLREQAKEIVRRYGSSGKEQTRSAVMTKLSYAFFQEGANLVEYRLTKESIVIEEDPFAAVGMDEQMEIRAKDWREKRDREVLLLDYKGERVTPFYVLKEMEKEIMLQREYINERDRELYEDILLKTVGRILRSRIQRAERWVKEMNALMQKRNASMGLLLSIQWKPKTAETEEEMDTKELVELLRMNSRLLREEDLQRVTMHFRSKINRAREMLEEKGQGNTLHQVIKEVLDYRKWFTFTLYYQKTNEPRRELTNQRFYQFSGGEKAMAMYIPLFAAAYARYQEASEDAPYIISLDEAFAGVDENNIRDMFELVETLGFNYIMNSQALWGDYDTVPSLSICELVRPKNASHVTVIRYYWNGTAKRLVTDRDEQEMAVKQ
ncbi:TIGR02680 family protein [Caenibacillus caldisaponilyticus]|uniref:TIGR02680 family protein n=1 Tax=Caenibacillus caldisaponilyticus TaxID=1674942 RepID=UPI000988919E|nr:TIGR02680 family protein [Caenibacillus caldisaponilyticus]